MLFGDLGLRPPFVTVVVTLFNYERYVPDCLLSIARQTYRDFKCIVVDDCSTDRSAAIVRQLIDDKRLDERFSLICHDANKGQMAAFKTGFENSQGEFIVYVDADDMLLPEFLAAHVRTHLMELPVAFTSSNQFQVDEHGVVIAGQHSDLQAKGRYRLVGPLYLFENVWVWATTSSMMFRRTALQMILPEVVEPFRICADNYLCHFANMIGGSVLVPERLGCYRRHGSNAFSKNRIVGGPHPTGDIRGHPPHEAVRKAILFRLLKFAEQFYGLLGSWPYLRVLARVVTVPEAIAIVVGGSWAGKIRLPWVYAPPFLLRNLLNRMRWRLRWIFPIRLEIVPLPRLDAVKRHRPDGREEPLA
jgi:glycosyltransferase involved in cell wall biosynthesis